MNAFTTIANAQQLLGMLSKGNKQAQQIFSMAKSQGLTDDDIAGQLSSSGLTEAQRRDLQSKLNGKKDLKQLLDMLKMAGTITAAGAGGYAIAKGAGKLATSLASAGGPVNLARQMMGTATQAPANMAQQMMGTGPAAAAPATATPAAQTIGKTLSGIASGIMNVFGFKNKPLVNAVAKIVEETGEEVKDVYDRLSKEYDVSTVEKATKAATDSLKKGLGEGKSEKAADIIERRESAEKRLENAKPILEAKKDLAKALKSSTIRKMNYDPEKQEMETIFNSGDKFRYYDFDQSSWDELSAKATPAKTSGKNKFGVWWAGKNPSLGATFNKIIQPSKRGNGPFRYEKVGHEAMTKEEEEEFEQIQRPVAKRAEKFLSSTEKAEKAQERVPKHPASITGEQVRNRVNLLNKQLESAKSKTGSDRNEKLIESIKDRLETMEEMDILRKTRKSKVVSEEVGRLDKHTGETYVKKLVTLLPAAVAKVVKSKIETTNEKDLLKTILEFLMSKK